MDVQVDVQIKRFCQTQDVKFSLRENRGDFFFLVVERKTYHGTIDVDGSFVICFPNMSY
jgi:hypothetical protein